MTDLMLPDPKGTGLENNPYLPQIHAYLENGWDAIRIARALKVIDGVDVDPREIAAYALKLPDYEQSGSALARHFRNRQVMIDTLQNLHYLLKVNEERLMKVIHDEGLLSGDGKYSVNVSQEIMRHAELLKMVTEQQKESGLSPYGQAMESDDAEPVVSLRDLLRAATGGRVKRIQSGDVIDGEVEELDG